MSFDIAQSYFKKSRLLCYSLFYFGTAAFMQTIKNSQTNETGGKPVKNQLCQSFQIRVGGSQGNTTKQRRQSLCNDQISKLGAMQINIYVEFIRVSAVSQSQRPYTHNRTRLIDFQGHTSVYKPGSIFAATNSRDNSHALTNTTRRHKYSRGLSRLLSVKSSKTSLTCDQ